MSTLANESSGSVRVDRYLWAIRICKTRARATELCRAGHVKIGVKSVKPAHSVSVGERITISFDGQTRVIEPIELIVTRVGAQRAQSCYLDRTPVAPKRDTVDAPFARQASAGRPTKRDRRMLDRLRAKTD